MVVVTVKSHYWDVYRDIFPFSLRWLKTKEKYKNSLKTFYFNSYKFALTRGTAHTKWPNASLSNRCRVAGGEERWVDRARLPDPGQTLCANGWWNLPVLLRGAAWLRLWGRGHCWGRKGRGWHRRRRRHGRLTWWRTEARVKAGMDQIYTFVSIDQEIHRAFALQNKKRGNETIRMWTIY